LVRETPRRGAIEHHYRATPRPKGSDGDCQQVSVIAKQAVISSELTQTAEVAARASAVGGFDSDHAASKRIGSGAIDADTALVVMMFDAVGAPDPSSGRPPGKPLKPRRQR
jgi:hypothetical protein